MKKCLAFSAIETAVRWARTGTLWSAEPQGRSGQSATRVARDCDSSMTYQ